MNDHFENIRREIFESFSKRCDGDVKIISQAEANFPLAKEYVEIWQVDTDLYDDEESVFLVEEISVYIAFSSQFPLELPKIYFNIDHFERIGFVPHVSPLVCDVCVFDDFVIVDETNPLVIVLELLDRAKGTLIEGMKKKNLQDYEDEFIAYWSTLSDKKDHILRMELFSLIRENPTHCNDVEVLLYKDKSSKNKKPKGIFYNKNEELIDNYKRYFDARSIPFDVFPAFFLTFSPPLERPSFQLTSFESQKLVPEKDLRDFRSFVNSNHEYHFVLFLKGISGEQYFLGWKLPTISKELNGFRASKISRFEILFKRSLPQASKSVLRFSTESLNQRRLKKRTSSSYVNIAHYKFIVGGIGSVGSNLIAHLNNINFPSFTLIDNDDLGSENIGRHLLGFKYLGYNKATSCKSYLQEKLPTQNVSVHQESIFDLFSQNPEIFNEQDYAFFCTGKQNIERWFLNQIETKELKIPCFFLWVEPFLLGGQLLFVHPGDVPDIRRLYADIYKFKFSIISHQELEIKRNLFTLKESGCQSTFSPYSSAHLSLYLAAVFGEIYKIIEGNVQKSKSFSWVGDTAIAEELDIQLNVGNNKKYTLIENNI